MFCRGLCFAVRARGYATIVPDRSARVVGVLWSLTPVCERTLDEFEEIDGGLYRRESVVVMGEPALIYLVSDATPGRAKAGWPWNCAVRRRSTA